MSRHRTVRSINYSEECDGYDDVYGHSVEEDYCISPSDAAQFMYNRESRNRNIGAFFKNEGIIDEGEEASSTNLSSDDVVNVRLESCVDSIKNTVGDSVSEQDIIKSAVKHDFNVEKAVDDILTNATEKTAPKIVTKDFNEQLKDTSSISSLTSLIKHHTETKMKTPLKFGLGKKLNFKKKIIDDTDTDLELSNTVSEGQLVDSDVSSSPVNRESLISLSDDFKKLNVDIYQNSDNFASDCDSLTDLVRSHLKQNINKHSNCIKIPNLKNITKKSSNITLSPSMSSPESSKTSVSEKLASLKKLLETHTPQTSFSAPCIDDDVSNTTKELNFIGSSLDETDFESDKFTIDLTQAIKPQVSINTVLKRHLETVKIVDNFVPEFIDCELPPELQNTKITETIKECTLDIRETHKKRTIVRKKCSNFGKIICRRYVRKNPFKLSRLSKPIRIISSFQFDKPSPDDRVLAILSLKFQN